MKNDTPPVTVTGLWSHARLHEALALVSDPLVREQTEKYRPWRKVAPIARAAGRDPELVWVATKWLRLAQWQELPLKSASGVPFRLGHTGPIAEQLHMLDRETGGGGSVATDREHGVLSDPDSQRRFLIRSMMDEAIDSSILEGAKTSIRTARELLRSGRPPKDIHERMVVNNYEAMRRVKSWLDRPLSPDMLLEIQSILTAGALDADMPPDASGRFRRDGEHVVVEDRRTGEIVHTPPPAHSLPDRLESLCRFANATHAGGRFLHPVLKASVLHFMVGYEHPFVDGNGRTARAVFYWCALRCGYRIFEFLPISGLIRAAAAKYPRAFQDCEVDDGDLTYFAQYKLGIIRRAVSRLGEYLAEEERRIEASRRLLRQDPTLNLRQRLLIEHALKHPHAEYTAKSQATTNAVSIMTARTDLLHLVKRRILSSFKVGKAVHYVLAPDAQVRLLSQRKRRGETYDRRSDR